MTPIDLDEFVSKVFDLLNRGDDFPLVPIDQLVYLGFFFQLLDPLVIRGDSDIFLVRLSGFTGVVEPFSMTSFRQLFYKLVILV